MPENESGIGGTVSKPWEHSSPQPLHRSNRLTSMRSYIMCLLCRDKIAFSEEQATRIVVNAIVWQVVMKIAQNCPKNMLRRSVLYSPREWPCEKRSQRNCVDPWATNVASISSPRLSLRLLQELVPFLLPPPPPPHPSHSPFQSGHSKLHWTDQWVTNLHFEFNFLVRSWYLAAQVHVPLFGKTTILAPLSGCKRFRLASGSWPWYIQAELGP